jgi:hypothetical protein
MMSKSIMISLVLF